MSKKTVYGQVRIYEPSDIEGEGVFSREEMVERLIWRLNNFPQNLSTVSVIAFRDVKRGYGCVNLIKNRLGPLEDYETEQFILNYREEVVEVFDSINSRFEILDL